MPQEWREVLERRNRTSKTKRLYEDGQPTRKYSWDGQVGASMHYPDAGGAWQDVDVNAEEPDTDGFTLKFTKLSYCGRVDGEGRRRFYPDRNDLAYWIEFKKPYANMGTPTRHNRWFYWDFAHATIGVRFDVDCLKFGFRLKDAQAPTSITIPFETQGITRQGRLLYHDGEVVAELRKPIATGSNLDAKGSPVQKDCEIVFAPGEVTISLDPTGLEYPIDIDPTVEVQVGASADDAFGSSVSDTTGLKDANIAQPYLRAGAWYSAPTQYYYGCGMRFSLVTIAQGSTIDVAYLTLRARYARSATVVNTNLQCEDIGDAPQFIATEDLAARTRTTALTGWDGISAWTVDSDKQSPPIVDTIQEVVDRGDWASNNALVVLWYNDGSTTEAEAVVRDAQSYDYSTEYAPNLHVEYTAGAIVTLAGVSAGVAGVSGNVVITAVLAGVSAGVASVFGVLYEGIQALILVAVKRSFVLEAETRKLALDAEKREFDLTAAHRDRP